MKLNTQVVLAAVFAGLIASAHAQTKAPDPAEVARLQKEVATAEAKGDYKSAALDLRILARLYKNDPAMLANTYTQLAQVSTQLHDDRKAAEYQALARGASAQPVVVPAPAIASVPAVAPAPAAPAQVYAAPAPPPPATVAGAPAPKPSNTDKVTSFFAQARQLMQQAKQVQEAMKQKGTKAPAGDQPAAPQPGAFPAGPDGAVAQAPAAPAVVDVAPAAGVVIGYDANNQPIFATGQPAPPR